MPDQFQHLQLAELIERVRTDQQQEFPIGVAIVHPANDLEVPDIKVVWHDDAYFVSTGSKWERGPLTKVKALGLSVGPARSMVMQFGPQKGKIKRIRGSLRARFDKVEAAAATALTCAHILWGVRADEWLWFTTTAYDDRKKMQRPAVWPPVG